MIFQCSHKFAHLSHSLWLGNANFVNTVELSCSKIFVPLNRREFALKLIYSEDVIQSRHIATFFACHSHLGDFSLNLQDILGCLLGCFWLIASKFHNCLDVVDVCVSDFCAIFIVFEIIVAVAHAQACLTRIKDVDIAILKVCHNETSKKRRSHIIVKPADGFHQIGAVHRCDNCQLFFDRCSTFGI